MEVPLPPTQADDAHVLPWVLLVLFLGLVYLAKLFLDGNKKCEERNNKLEEKFDASVTYTQTILVNCINENTHAFRSLKRDMAEHDFIPQDEESDTQVNIPEKTPKHHLKVKK
jgi:hypothetical protein